MSEYSHEAVISMSVDMIISTFGLTFLISSYTHLALLMRFTFVTYISLVGVGRWGVYLVNRVEVVVLEVDLVGLEERHHLHALAVHGLHGEAPLERRIDALLGQPVAHVIARDGPGSIRLRVPHDEVPHPLPVLGGETVAGHAGSPADVRLRVAGDDLLRLERLERVGPDQQGQVGGG